MENWHDSTSQKNTDVNNGRDVEILCDHQDHRGNCCNKRAEYRTQHKGTQYPFYTCKRCFDSYYSKYEDDTYLLR